MEKQMCRVCGLPLSGMEAECPRCKFPVIAMMTGSDEEKEAMDRLVKEYSLKYWSKASVSLRVYSNRLTENGEVEVASSELVLLGKASDFEPGKILWYPEKFARLFVDCSLELMIEDDNGKQETKTVTLENPRVQDFWSVGILPGEQKDFRIVLGTPKQYSKSEPVSLS